MIPNLAFKFKQDFGAAASRCAMLKELSQFVDEIANLRPNPRLPWVGAAAFSHKGGQHVNAVQKLRQQLRAHRPVARRQPRGTC